jgi:PBP1b-binding outer membrane lipoprotein LpoB
MRPLGFSGKEASAMKQVISLVAMLAVLLSGCAMSSTSTTDANRDPARAQERPAGSEGGSY